MRSACPALTGQTNTHAAEGNNEPRAGFGKHPTGTSRPRTVAPGAHRALEAHTTVHRKDGEGRKCEATPVDVTPTAASSRLRHRGFLHERVLGDSASADLGVF